MPHVVALALAILFVCVNIYLWSMKQEPVTLFWESAGGAAIAFPAFFWYVTRFTTPR
jgi:hypothetical protein